MFFINHKEIEHGKAAIVEIEGPLNSESGTDFDDYTKKLIENETLFIIVAISKESKSYCLAINDLTILGI